MSDLSKTYDAQTVDAKWYAYWENEGFFAPDLSSEKPSFCIVIPPPNVTGALHMGHALGSTLDDILIRWKRMSGFETLWIPGTDHAGIATQTVVERHLMQQEGKRRADYTREAFLKHVWDWKEKHEHKILSQLKKLGCSCDWSRLRFTMDEGSNRAVRCMFKKLFDAGLIYRGDYLVNWDPVAQTAIADDEVEYEERQGFLWYFRYPTQEGNDYAVIATTRPETMLGDTAIAIHPDNPHTAHLLGKTILLPLVDRPIPVITDPFVDPAFGSGVVKVTPAHDPNDYEMGLRHKLPFINILTPDGRINENGGRFAGLTLSEARIAIVKEMESLGLLEKKEPHVHRVGISYRSKATIEPYLSKQWFVNMRFFAPKLRSAVQEERVSLIPPSWQNTYFHWIDNLRDWCISRQLWWGHRIPIWYRKENPEEMICYAGDEVPPEVAADPEAWTQDPDVLDTWFSSALFPFSTLGWPDKTPELEKFYPNSVMITGHDILFFWVARMIMMGEYALDLPPFPEVYLHSLIYGKSYWRKAADGNIRYVDGQERIAYDLGQQPVPADVHSKWEKMSKSKGNIIDPLEVIQEYGTDAMRMALCASATQTWEIDLDRRRFEEFKNFTNKIWNGARFILMNLQQEADPLTTEQLSEGLELEKLSLEDRWILSALSRTVSSVNTHLKNYYFDQAAGEAYDFYWKELCSNYLEMVKPVLFGKAGDAKERKNKQKLLLTILSQSLRLLHPMAPFITEELFQTLKTLFGKSSKAPSIDHYTAELIDALDCRACIIAPYPQRAQGEGIDLKAEQAFSFIEQIVYTIRNIRGEMKIPPGLPVDVHCISQRGSAEWALLERYPHLIGALVKVGTILLHAEEPSLGFTATAMVGGMKILIPLPVELVKQELARLEKERARLEKQRERIQSQLANSEFVEKAPEALIKKQRSLLEQTEKELEEIQKKCGSHPL